MESTMTSNSATDDPFESAFKTTLLRSESPRSFNQVRDFVYQQLAPQTPLDYFLARQITFAMLDVERNQRLRIAILNNAFLPALQNLLEPTAEIPVMTDLLVRGYFTNAEDRKKVLEKLAAVGLTETDVEAEAFRIRSREIESISNLLAAAERRLQKLSRSFKKHRRRSSIATPDVPAPIDAKLGTHEPSIVPEEKPGDE
jgi:hypothetical protein